MPISRCWGASVILVVDTQGLALNVVVSASDTQDRANAQLVAEAQISLIYPATCILPCS